MIHALLMVSLFLLVVLPSCRCGATPATMGDTPRIILPFPPGAEVMFAVYWSLDPNMTHSFSFWVIDNDGVDSAIVSYMPLSEGVWHNISAMLTEGNTTKGFYEASYSGHKDGVEWKVFANDSQGHWTENGTIRYLLDTIGIDPKIILAVAVPFWLIIAATVVFRRKKS